MRFKYSNSNFNRIHGRECKFSTMKTNEKYEDNVKNLEGNLMNKYELNYEFTARKTYPFEERSKGNEDDEIRDIIPGEKGKIIEYCIERNKYKCLNLSLGHINAWFMITSEDLEILEGKKKSRHLNVDWIYELDLIVKADLKEGYNFTEDSLFKIVARDCEEDLTQIYILESLENGQRYEVYPSSIFTN